MATALISILPLLIVLGLAWWGIRRFGRRPGGKEPDAIGGWLALLIFGLTVGVPLIGTLRLVLAMKEAVGLHPELASLTAWARYELGSYVLQAVVALASAYAGLKLAYTRERGAVPVAIGALWIVGPGRAVLDSFVLVPAVLGVTGGVAEGIANIIGGVIVAGLWTWYLCKSVRVKLRYILPPRARAALSQSS